MGVMLKTDTTMSAIAYECALDIEARINGDTVSYRAVLNRACAVEDWLAECLKVLPGTYGVQTLVDLVFQEEVMSVTYENGEFAFKLIHGHGSYEILDITTEDGVLSLKQLLWFVHVHDMSPGVSLWLYATYGYQLPNRIRSVLNYVKAECTRRAFYGTYYKNTSERSGHRHSLVEDPRLGFSLPDVEGGAAPVILHLRHVSVMSAPERSSMEAEQWLRAIEEQSANAAFGLHDFEVTP